MTLLTLGWAAEYAALGVAANCLWPATTIATAAVANLLGGVERSRSPEIMGHAAVAVVSRPRGERTGRTLLDVEVLAEAGITDLSHYGGGDDPQPDLFLDAP
jgi:hypothetical protein